MLDLIVIQVMASMLLLAKLLVLMTALAIVVNFIGNQIGYKLGLRKTPH